MILVGFFTNGNMLLFHRSLKLFDSLKSKPDILKKDLQQDVKKDMKDKKEVLRDKIKAIKQQIKSENEKEKKDEGTVR
jgi:hypothetical protein